MPDAIESVDVKQAWVRRVLGIDIRSASGAEPEGLRGQLNEIGLNLRQLSATPGFPAIAKRFAEAVAALKAGQWSVVEAVLAEVGPQVAAGLSGARGDEARDVITASRAWRDACAQVTSAIEGFKASVISALKAEDEHEPEELDVVSEALDAELEPIVARLNTGISDQVDAAINGAADRRAKAVAQVLARVGEVEAAFKGNDTLAVVEGNGLVPITIAAPVLSSLAELRRVLSARAAGG